MDEVTDKANLKLLTAATQLADYGPDLVHVFETKATGLRIEVDTESRGPAGPGSRRTSRGDDWPYDVEVTDADNSTLRGADFPE